MIIHHNHCIWEGMGLFGLQVQSIFRGRQERNWSRDHGLLNPLAYTTSCPGMDTCPQGVGSSFISISNQENTPADLSTSNLMEICSSLRFFFPDNFYLCRVDKETHQDSKGECSKEMKKPGTFLQLLGKITLRKTSADVESSWCH